MAGGSKPDVTVRIKEAGKGNDAPETSLFSWWRNEKGGFRGGLDGRVKRIRVELQDGTKVDVGRITLDNGKAGTSHWVNLKIWDESRGTPSTNTRGAKAATAAAKGDAWDDGNADTIGDDLPF